jgi:hypothetical protein
LRSRRYSVADVFLFIVYKVLRGDFHYWIPIYGPLGLLVSFSARVITKVICDYTGMIQLRHPGELGGMYWTLNVILAFVASFGAASYFFSSRLEKGLIDQRLTEMLLTGIVALWVASFCVILFLMKKKYRATFSPAAPGWQSVRATRARRGASKPPTSPP